jgi:hypothetical protein
MKKFLVLSVSAMTLGVCGAGASAAVVDDFSSGLGAYTLSRVNDGNTTANIAFSTAGGDLRSSYSSTPNAFEQVLLLRGDASVAVGEILIADVVGWSGNVNYDRDLGIAVGYTATPASLSGAATGDVRSSFVEVSIRGNNQVVSFAKSDATNLASGQIFTGSGTPALNIADPLYLYIAHTGATTYEVGVGQNGVRRIVGSYTFSGVNVPGASVGLYSDLRTALGTTPIGLDNLRIEAIPEPTTFAAVGLAGTLIRRRRRA